MLFFVLLFISLASSNSLPLHPGCCSVNLADEANFDLKCQWDPDNDPPQDPYSLPLQPDGCIVSTTEENYRLTCSFESAEHPLRLSFPSEPVLMNWPDAINRECLVYCVVHEDSTRSCIDSCTGVRIPSEIHSDCISTGPWMTCRSEQAATGSTMSVVTLPESIQWVVIDLPASGITAEVSSASDASQSDNSNSNWNMKSFFFGVGAAVGSVVVIGVIAAIVVIIWCVCLRLRSVSSNPKESEAEPEAETETEDNEKQLPIIAQDVVLDVRVEEVEEGLW